MTTNEFKDKYFVYDGCVHQIKRVNKVTLSTYLGVKIDIKYVSNRIIGDSPIAACDAYLAMLSVKLNSEMEYANRTNYDSAFRDVARVEQRIARITALRNRVLETQSGNLTD